MEKIHIVFTSQLNAKTDKRETTAIIAFGSKKAAETFMNERKIEEERQREYQASEGIFDTKWWIEEISLSDVSFSDDKLEADWQCSIGDNYWWDHKCSNCGWTVNLPPKQDLNATYCSGCGAKMTNPKGGRP